MTRVRLPPRALVDNETVWLRILAIKICLKRLSRFNARVVQLAETSDSKPECCGFDSHRGHLRWLVSKGKISEMGEQWVALTIKGAWDVCRWIGTRWTHWHRTCQSSLWRVLLSARKVPFQGTKTGSIPVRAINSLPPRIVVIQVTLDHWIKVRFLGGQFTEIWKDERKMSSLPTSGGRSHEPRLFLGLWVQYDQSGSQGRTI